MWDISYRTDLLGFYRPINDIQNGKTEGTSGQNGKLNESSILAEIEKITSAISGIANIDIDVTAPFMKLESIAQTVKELAKRPRKVIVKR